MKLVPLQEVMKASAAAVASGRPTALNPASAKALRELTLGFHRTIVEIPAGVELDTHVQAFFRRVVNELPADIRNGATVPAGAFDARTLRLELERLRPLTPPAAGAVQTDHTFTQIYDFAFKMVREPAGMPLRYHEEQTFKRLLESLPPEVRNGATVPEKGFSIVRRAWGFGKLERVETPHLTTGAVVETLTRLNLWG